jgi:very-short-patch-repair endonuclease
MALAESQHWVVATRQLREIGVSSRAIAHRRGRGLLHPVLRGAYAVGRADITPAGRWMAAVLVCGDDSAISHHSGGAMWELVSEGPDLHVSVRRDVRRTGIRVHVRTRLSSADVTVHRGIPVTTPARTLIDLAVHLGPRALERAIEEADKRDVLHWEDLQVALRSVVPGPGVGKLRRVLSRHTFTLTESELERRFLPIARAAGLPEPLTQHELSGFRIDFYWPGLGLVVETDGLRYHRTPAAQARDAQRDQAHIAAGRIPLRFSHDQITYQPGYVQATLHRVARRLSTADRIRSFGN